MTKFLITGATGNQGKAVINALLDGHNASRPFTILALTRNPDSPAAKKLAAQSSIVKLVKGDMEDAEGVFKAASAASPGSITGVFSVQSGPGPSGYAGADAEIRQAKGLINQSLKHGVRHFVQGSVERGGDEVSWNTPTNVPHFASKYEIEHYLKDNAGSMTWTIPRPVAFMDNIEPGFGTRVFATALQNSLRGKRLAWIATRDIGIIVAQALLNPEDPSYRNKAFGIAGDNLTMDEFQAVFAKHSTSPPKPTLSIFATAFLYFVKEFRLMINWFGEEGWDVDVAQTKKLVPGAWTLDDWVKQSAYANK